MSDPSTELLQVLAKLRAGLGPDDGVVNTADVDKAVELAKQVDRLLNPTPQPIITAEDLHRLAPGRKVKDSAGDVWTKQEDGWWAFTGWRDLSPWRTSAEHLIHVWAPLHALPEEN